MRPQKNPNWQSNCEKNNKAKGVKLPIFRLYYEVTVMLEKDRHTDQYRRTERLEKPTPIWSIHLWQRMQNTQLERYSCLWFWEKSTASCKRKRLEHFFTQYTRINSKQIDDLNIRLETLKLIEGNTGRTHFDIRCSNTFFTLSLQIKLTKINKQTLIKFCTAKETIDKM